MLKSVKDTQRYFFWSWYLCINRCVSPSICGTAATVLPKNPQSNIGSPCRRLTGASHVFCAPVQLRPARS